MVGGGGGSWAGMHEKAKDIDVLRSGVDADTDFVVAAAIMPPHRTAAAAVTLKSSDCRSPSCPWPKTEA